MKRKGLSVIMVMLMAGCVVAGCKKKSDSNYYLLLLLGGERQLELATFQEASLVLGQPDFITGIPTSPAQNTFSAGAYSQPAAVKGKLYLPDYTWNRILVYEDFPTANNQNADTILGQSNWTSVLSNRGNPTSADLTLDGPECVSSDINHFLVQDYGNNRVLIYNSIPDTYNRAADVVVGQPDFTSAASSTSSTGFRELEHAIIAGGKLIVADSGNNRVLIYNSIPATNGAAADIVLGQQDFIHSGENDTDNDGVAEGLTASTLFYPTGLWSDGTRLVVADRLNNRVLIWNTFPRSNFQSADVAVGQDSMTANGPHASAAGMHFPYFVTVHAGQLIVADSGNNRVLIFNSIPTSNGKAADIVLGQGDFTHNAPNDDNQDNGMDAAPSARTMFEPIGVCVMNSRLIVSDRNNSRMLVFE